MDSKFETRKEDLKNLKQVIETVDPQNTFYKESLNEVKNLLKKMESRDNNALKENTTTNNEKKAI